MSMVTQMSLTSISSNLLLSTLFSLIAIESFAAVGTVTEQNGPVAQITRDNEKLVAEKGTGVEMNDTIVTAKTRLGLTFDDDTRVAITEQSRLIIDDFVYDGNNNTGKLTMRIALGTVRYASGAIAHNNNESVKLSTPTATIAVRGTDFTMTVDEIGRSLIILLPSCNNPADANDCFTGEITVETDAGFVILNQAYQATVAASASSPPTAPKIISTLEMHIDNMLIISPPRELPGGMAYIDQAKETSYLEDDLLLFEELIKELLTEDRLAYGMLDINYLDIEYLDNILDLTNMLKDDELGTDPVLPNINPHKSWIQYSYNEEQIYLYAERLPHIAQVTLERYTDGIVTIVQDGIEAPLQINEGGSSVVINITQSQ